jgi:hypothetical protein
MDTFIFNEGCLIDGNKMIQLRPQPIGKQFRHHISKALSKANGPIASYPCGGSSSKGSKPQKLDLRRGDHAGSCCRIVVWHSQYHLSQYYSR